MDAIVLFSGGKDSCLALWSILNQGWKVKFLLTVFSKNPESFMFHYPNVRWTEAQAQSLGIPLKVIESRGIQEEEVEDLYTGLKNLLENVSIDCIVSGAISSDYQRRRIDDICKRLGVVNVTPLWHKDPYLLLLEQVKLGFKIIITACMAMGLNRDWLGRKLTLKTILQLKRLSEHFGFNLTFEGGEAETFVLDGPIFHQKIIVNKYEILWDGYTGRYIIKDLKVQSK